MTCRCHVMDTMCGYCRTSLWLARETPQSKYLGGSLDWRTAAQIRRDEAGDVFLDLNEDEDEESVKP
jgi:hypothetical protein